MTKTSLATSTTATEAAGALHAEIRNLATMIGVRDGERVNLVAKEIFSAAHDEKMSLQHVAQAVQDYARGRVEGYNSSFFPTPADILRRARYCRDNRPDDPDRESHHDRPVKYPPGIQKRIDAIQKILKSEEYRIAKYHHLMRLKAAGKMNYDPVQK